MNAPRAYLALVAFSILGTLLSALTGLDPGPIKPIAGVVTLALGVYVLMQPLLREFHGHQTVRIVLPILLVGTASEICGVYTGWPFGKYEYTSAWWPTVALPGDKLFPLCLPFAWLMMAAGGYLLVAHHVRGWLAVLLGAGLVTLIDLPMEWVMTQHLGYWKWTDPTWPIGEVYPGVPLLNSFGWLVTALVAGAMLHQAGVHRVDGSREARVVLGGHLALLLGIGLINALLVK